MTVEYSKRQKEDSWASVEIGEPFPDAPVRVAGEQNQYVALGYKHGKPVCGRARNDGGVVECSFPYTKTELTDEKDLGGKIQILVYDNTKDEKDMWRETGFTYRWVPWRERAENNRQLVGCTHPRAHVLVCSGALRRLGGDSDARCRRRELFRQHQPHQRDSADLIRWHGEHARTPARLLHCMHRRRNARPTSASC
jgi:hypothetical protein